MNVQLLRRHIQQSALKHDPIQRYRRRVLHPAYWPLHAVPDRLPQLCVPPFHTPPGHPLRRRERARPCRCFQIPLQVIHQHLSITRSGSKTPTFFSRRFSVVTPLGRVESLSVRSCGYSCCLVCQSWLQLRLQGYTDRHRDWSRSRDSFADRGRCHKRICRG